METLVEIFWSLNQLNKSTIFQLLCKLVNFTKIASFSNVWFVMHQNGHSFFHSIFFFLNFSHYLFQSTKFVKAFIVGLSLLSNMQHVFSSTKEMVSIRTKKGGFSKLKKPLRIKTSMKATLRTIKNHTIQQRSLATTLGYHKPS